MSQFIDFLHEIFSELGSINTRKMFGGYGIYHDGVMFGLIADDTLYLKVDESTKQQFIDKDLTAFEFDKGNKKVQMSYYQVPEEIYDDPDAAIYWAKLAYQAALKSKTTRKKNH